jgi:hypothetical protein
MIFFTNLHFIIPVLSKLNKPKKNIVDNSVYYTLLRNMVKIDQTVGHHVSKGNNIHRHRLGNHKFTQQQVTLQKHTAEISRLANR